MRYRALVLLLIAVVLGAVAAYMVNTVVTQQVAQPAAVTPLATSPAVVAVIDLEVGLVLEPIHLRLVDFPVEAYPASAYTSVDQVLGADQPNIVMTPIVAGEIVLPTKLSSGIEFRGLTTRIPDGYRAVSIPVNEVRGVGGFVLPGDRVDVLHTTALGRRDERPVTRTLLQNMIVLGVDQLSSEIADEPVLVNVVTLLSDPTQAKTLTLAQQVGDLTLLLRNEGDRDAEESPTVALDDLWEYTPEDFQPRAGSGAAGAPASKPGVQVIRGLQVTQETVGADGVVEVQQVN